MIVVMVINILIGMPVIGAFAQEAPLDSTTESQPGGASGSKTVAEAVYEDTSDMLLWYKFDETSGTTAVDSSGRGNDGVLQGGASWAKGKILGSVKLDGVNGRNS